MWSKDAHPGAPGHATFVRNTGAGRIDNPDLYRVLYVGDSPAGAAAEAFGRYPEWTPEMFLGRDPPGSRYGIAAMALARTRLIDLDDPNELALRELRPSRVVSRDRPTTHAWARTIFGEGSWGGIRWWSRYDSRWASMGIWDLRAVRVQGPVEPLHPAHPAVVEAAEVLARTWT